MEGYEQKTRRQYVAASNNYFNLSEDENDRITVLFNKRFALVDNESYVLPKLSSIFKYPLWSVPKLQKLKKELNNVKDCLNNYDLDEWQSHTKLRNSAKDVMPRLKSSVQPELLTQAWCKFHEIVASFPLIPVDYIYKNNNYFKSVHLCEAPGAFVTSLNHWLKSNVPGIQWDWTAITLNPYYEGNSVSTMIDDDRFIRYTLDNWYFGEDNTGNIMDLKNSMGLVNQVMPHENIFLVTADGSIDCADVPAEQENVLTRLHFCETVTALQLLSPGGSFLLKMFTTFECNTICLLYLLACCFTNISIIKPATSKEGNSEVYVVCTNYKKPVNIMNYINKLKDRYESDFTTAVFNEKDVPLLFIQKIIKCSDFFKIHQCSVIQNNIVTFKNHNPSIIQSVRQIQRSVAERYIKDYNIRKLEMGEEIVGNVIMLMKPANFSTFKISMQGSYNERCEKKRLGNFDRLQSFYEDIEKVEINLLNNEIKKYKFTQMPDVLRIRTGKVFRKILSSKFCNKLALKVLNGVDDLIGQLDQNRVVQFPSEDIIKELKATFTSEDILLPLLYTNVYDSHRLIMKVHEALSDIKRGQRLILTGYSLLTHLSNELLHLIGCTFNRVDIMVHNAAGLIIILENYYYNEKVLKYLDEIKAASLEAQHQRTTILEIFHPCILYDGCGLQCTSDFNHWIIKAYVHHVVALLKEKKFLIKFC